MRNPPRSALFQEGVLGTASPHSWLITMNSPIASEITHLPKSQKTTLAHEFGHLLHYFTTYIGLSDLLHWARALKILRESRPKEVSQEEHVTSQSRQLIAVARQKQVLSIDDFYYLERVGRMCELARTRAAPWLWRESTGGLFNVRGEVSDRRFWCLRFSLAQDGKEIPFVRIPLGLRTILEHMAVAIDIISEQTHMTTAEFERYLSRLADQAYIPEALHYYALTHRFSSLMSRMYGDGNLQWRFVACAYIILLLADIPFDDPSTWSNIRNYAVRRVPDLGDHMTHPHPSFVFPVLLRALEELAPSLNRLTSAKEFENNANSLLSIMGLPTLDLILQHREARANEVRQTLDEAEPSGAWSKLVTWMDSHEAGLSRAEKIAHPIKGLRQLPVPVYFSTSQKWWDGLIISYEQSRHLADLDQRNNEMLRYPIARDIVD